MKQSVSFRPPSVASRIERELESDVRYGQAIDAGIANLSAIAQQLSEKIRCGKDAAKVAVARWARKRVQQSQSFSDKVKGVLSTSTVSLQDDIAVVVVESSPSTRRALSLLEEIEVKSIVLGAKSITVICSAHHCQRAVKAFGGHALIEKKGLCLIQLSSKEDIERVPGVYAYVLEAFARRGINVVESSSCYTETNIIVRQADALAGFEAMQTACGKR